MSKQNERHDPPAPAKDAAPAPQATTQQPQSAVAVLEQPAPAASKYDDGIYEMWLVPECPVASWYVPCIEYHDDEFHTTRVTGVTVPKHRVVNMLVCSASDCGERWEPEFPLRPAAVLELMPDLKRRFKESRYCPKCRKSGRVSRGQAMRPAPGAPTGRPIHERVWLTGAERARIDKYLDPAREVTNEVSEIVLPVTGEKVTRNFGPNNPIPRVRVVGDMEMSTLVPVRDFMRIAPLVDSRNASPEFMQLWSEVQGRAANLRKIIGRENDELEVMGRAGRSPKEVEDQRKKIDRLKSEYAALVNRLVSEA